MNHDRGLDTNIIRVKKKLNKFPAPAIEQETIYKQLEATASRLLLDVLLDGKLRCVQMQRTIKSVDDKPIPYWLLAVEIAYGFLNPIDAAIGDLVYHAAIVAISPTASFKQVGHRVALPPSDSQPEFIYLKKVSEFWWERIE